MRPAAFKLRWVALACTAWFCSTGYAALFEDEEARRAVLDLRQRVDTLRQSSDSSSQRLSEDNAQIRRSLLDLQNQIETLRNEQSALRGSNEQLQRHVADLQNRQKDMAQGMDERLRQFEPVAVTLDGQTFNADPAEKRAFDAALELFRSGNFAAAQAALLDMQKRYPKSGYAPSLVFWLGNTQYAQRNYKDAIAQFKQLLASAPQHPRAPEAALSIANSQSELKDTKSARKTLEDLLKVYPHAEAAAAAAERLARMK